MNQNSAAQRYEKSNYVEHICRYVVNEKKNALDVCRMFRLYDILHQRNVLTIDFRNVPFDEARKIIEEETSNYFFNY
jgi:hypothetical protein